MSETRGQTYAELYWKLDTKNDENDVYKMAKLQEKKKTSTKLNILRMRLIDFL
jgi:hypothetical protein